MYDYSTAIDAYKEILIENKSLVTKDYFTPRRVGMELFTEPFPLEALPLGIAYSDFRPILANILYPKELSSVLLSGDSKSGKTGFLKFIVGASDLINSDIEEFVVITDNTSEWKNLSNKVSTVIHYSSSQADDQILSMASHASLYASQGRVKKASILLLDNFDKISSLDFDAVENLKYILLKGYRTNQWVIATSSWTGWIFENWSNLFGCKFIGRKGDNDVLKNLSDGDYVMRDSEGKVLLAYVPDK